VINIVAIDPGLTGAVAFLYPETPDRVGIFDMPAVNGEVNAAALADLIKLHAPSQAIIELVGPMPRDGVRQVWKFSGAYHTARAVLALLNIPVALVTPATWKKSMKLCGGPEGKEASRARALQFFPACSAHFARKSDHNRAEAALLAKYACETLFPHSTNRSAA
jgi:hypothetical protein